MAVAGCYTSGNRFVLIASASAPLSIPQNSPITLNFDVTDPNSVGVGTRSSTMIITLPFSGLYEFSAYTNYAGDGSSTPGIRKLFFQNNLSTLEQGAIVVPAVQSTQIALTCNFKAWVNAGDSWVVNTYHTSTTANLNAGVSPNMLSKLVIMKVDN